MGMHSPGEKEKIGRLLVQTYPQIFSSQDGERLLCRDGSTLPLDQTSENPGTDNGPGICEQFATPYLLGLSNIGQRATNDPGRTRCLAFFQKMYGKTREEVMSNLVEIAWMPRHVNKKILVTRVNGVDQQLLKVSDALDQLPRHLRKFVRKLGGTFNWRTIAGSEQLSPHAFGIAIDINTAYGDYWKWDAERAEGAQFRNRIPREIIEIFERHGFIWGGKWHQYDTMHFEYRPELIKASNPDFGKINLLFLSREPAMYGAERQLSYLVEGLAPERYSCVIVHSQGSDGSGTTGTRHAEYVTLALRPWSKIGNLARRYLDAYRLLALARQKQIQLIHCSYQWLLPYALFVGKKMNIPVVGHLRRPNNTAQKLMRLGCHKCDAMIAISARTRRELMSTPIAIQNIHLISDSVDTAAFTTGVERSLRAELGLEDQLLFGLVARVYPSKRQLDFLQAARQLLEQDANVHFVLVGRIEDEPYWQTLKAFIAQHRLENRIHCLGHRNDITQVIASLDVLVSLAGGSVMYEAMALGKTVISAGFTRPEDSTHVIDQVTGLVTPSLEPQALVHLMRRALEDATLRARLGQAAQAWAQSHFSKTVLVKKTEDTYKQVLGARKSSPWFLTG